MISVEVGSVPGRKSKAISVVDGSVSHVVAYFRDDESYERFKAACQGFARLAWEEPTVATSHDFPGTVL